MSANSNIGKRAIRVLMPCLPVHCPARGQNAWPTASRRRTIPLARAGSAARGRTALPARAGRHQGLHFALIAVVKAQHVHITKRRQTVNPHGGTAPERHLAFRALRMPKLSSTSEQTVISKDQHMAGIQQGHHQQRPIATVGKARLKGINQRIKFIEMFFA